MDELARYQHGSEGVVVFREGAQLVFRSEYDDNGRFLVDESRLSVDDFVTKGQGPWPWFDLGDKRDGALQVLTALGVDPPTWTHRLQPEVLDLFERAQRGDTWVIELLAMGADPDPVDRCGASPLWYAVRSESAGIVVALIDDGADAGRRIELSAGGECFTTILHEIVRHRRVVALKHAVASGVDPSLTDSDGATAMHVLGDDADNVGAEMVRTLAGAGASVEAATPSGTQPIENATRRLLPATVAALVELGADTGRGLDALMTWWSITGARFYGHRTSDVVDVIDVLRAGGAEVTDRHRERVAGACAVEVALRR
jgi:hypothetical protein